MIEMLKVLIAGCLDNPECLNTTEIEFVQKLDESMMMPEQMELQQLKRLWNKVNDAREVA